MYTYPRKYTIFTISLKFLCIWCSNAVMQWCSNTGTVHVGGRIVLCREKWAFVVCGQKMTDNRYEDEVIWCCHWNVFWNSYFAIALGSIDWVENAISSYWHFCKKNATTSTETRIFSFYQSIWCKKSFAI